jgi:hypothetical protein
MQAVHVRNVFNLYLPLAASKEASGIVHDIASVPSVSFSLFDKDQLAQEEYYHLKLLILDHDNVERELPGGLSWAKRRPLTLIQDSVNQLAGVSLRFKIPEGIIDFRRHRLRTNRARIVVSNANGGSWTNQAVTPIFEIHQKRRSPESTPQDHEVTIGLQWLNPNTTDQDSVQDSLVFTDEADTPEFVTNKSTELHDFSMLNEGYVRLYDGNAEITGNLRALNFYKLSDRRMKTDIKSLSSKDCRKILLCIEGVEYKFKSGNTSSNRKFIGYIAQQVQQAIPEAVTTIDGVLHVDYQSIIPYISEALRQTNTDVEGIESHMKQFQSMLENLHARFCEQEAEYYPDPQKTAPFIKRLSPFWLTAIGSCLFLTVIILSVVMLSVGSVTQSTKDQTERSQRSILIDLYDATKGDYWTNKTGWLSNGTVCEWFGVKCSASGEVTELWMSFNRLNGTIPSSLANLTSLVAIRLSNNHLSGTIPQSLGQLDALQVLHLDINLLSGTIPQSLGQLLSIESLHLGINLLSGTIPASLGQLKNLQELNVANNQLSGTIPQSFEQLSAAKRLDLGGNQLIGTVPSLLGQLSQLQLLRLGNNQFSETIPESIGNLTALEVLDVRHNLLVGTIPPSLFALKNLERLYLNDNQLSAAIPMMTELPHLQWIDLSNNNFSEILTEEEPVIFLYDSHCFMDNNNFKCPIPEWPQRRCKAVCRW